MASVARAAATAPLTSPAAPTAPALAPEPRGLFRRRRSAAPPAPPAPPETAVEQPIARGAAGVAAAVAPAAAAPATAPAPTPAPQIARAERPRLHLVEPPEPQAEAEPLPRGSTAHGLARALGVPATPGPNGQAAIDLGGSAEPAPFVPFDTTPRTVARFPSMPGMPAMPSMPNIPSMDGLREQATDMATDAGRGAAQGALGAAQQAVGGAPAGGQDAEALAEEVMKIIEQRLLHEREQLGDLL
jgi:hypothetical protein